MNVERIAKLEALLARIQKNASAPRAALAPKAIPRTVPFEVEPIAVAPPAPVIIHQPEPEPVHVEEPVEPLAAPIAVAPEPEELQPVELESIAPEPMQDVAPVEVSFDEPPQEHVSGEFEVAAQVGEEAPLELEELGPADDLEPGETVVEIDMSAPAPMETSHEPAQEEAREEHHSQPPESGRELIATPHESTRVAVAAPVVPDEPEPPPESSRNLKVAPLPPETPATSDIVEVEPPTRAPMPSEPPPQLVELAEPIAPQIVPEIVPVIVPMPEPEPIAMPMLAAEPARVPESEPPQTRASSPPREEVGEPVQAAVAVQLRAPEAHAREVQNVVVAVDADVIHPNLTPRDVAAFVGAVRAPRPETFGALLDAALDL